MNLSSRVKDLFLLDPRVIYLNHGSFGACPRPVFESYQSWQRELESQPVEFLGRRAEDLLAEARKSLADFLGADADEVVYFPNPTTAMNMIARNLARYSAGASSAHNPPFCLRPGDEILASDHEYGALNRTWRYICRQIGASYVTVPIPLPLEEPEEFVERFWAGVTSRTRMIFLSHITSPTALIFPVREICRRARLQGIFCLVDGAHAPGQIPLDLHRLDVDFYAGACHKWLCAPKGSAFLYVRRELQASLDPLVISWGYESEKPSGSQFIDYHEWQGTRDLSAYLSVPQAIRFQYEHDWVKVRQECHVLAIQARQQIEGLTGMSTICSDDKFSQMFSVHLPGGIDQDQLQKQLYLRYRIEVPVVCWNNELFLRISIQAYNDEEDIEALIQALRELL